MAQNLTTLAPKTPTTFRGITGGLVGAAQQGSPQAQQYTAQTAQYGAGNLPIGSEAADIAKQYGQKIADVGQQGAAFRSGQLTTGTSPVAEGNAAVTAQNTAAQQQALATGEEAALQGTGQQLTAQQQAANAANQAAGQAYTGQGLEQTGLNQAATLAQPQLGSIAQIPFSPLSQGQGAPLGSEAPGGILGAARLAGQVQGAQAEGAAPGQGQAQATQALIAAPGLGQAQGTQAVAAAPGLGQATGTQAIAAAPGTTQAGQYGQIAQYKSAVQQGDQLASQLNNLITSFNLNPSDINAVNAGFQKIAANTSDPRYQILSNYLNDVASRYAQVLTPPGGSATDMTRSIAQSMINATASGKSIRDVLGALGQQAQAVINAVPATGTVPGGSSQFQNGQKTTAGGYNFVFQNGKWVPE